MAWRSELDRAALPGPFVYWLCTAAVVVCLASVSMLLLRIWRVTRDRGRVRLGVETRAHFASRHDLAPLVVDQPVPTGRFVLGRVHGRLVATEDRKAAEAANRRVSTRQGDRGSVAVIGPPRSGKTVNVIAGLLDWDGPAMVVSVKRDLIDATPSIATASAKPECGSHLRRYRNLAGHDLAVQGATRRGLREALRRRAHEPPHQGRVLRRF